MDYSSSIDALAFAGKLTVETSGLNRDNKEWIKLGIEDAQTLLKAMQQPQATIMSVGSIFLGLILGKLRLDRNNAPWKNAFILLMMRWIVYIPRASFFEWLTTDMLSFRIQEK